MESGPKPERKRREEMIKAREWMRESPSDVTFVARVAGMRVGECREE